MENIAVLESTIQAQELQHEEVSNKSSDPETTEFLQPIVLKGECMFSTCISLIRDSLVIVTSN